MDRIYYLKNKEKILERRKQRYQENKEKELAYSKKYVENLMLWRYGKIFQAMKDFIK